MASKEPIIQPVNTMYDAVPWGKMEDPITGQEFRAVCLPFTRYANILGRPKVITNVETAFPTDFSLLAVGEVEIDDDIIFDMAGQVW